MDVSGMVVNRGRYIVQAREVRDLQFHEASIDLSGGEVDMNSGDLLKTGTFETAARSL